MTKKWEADNSLEERMSKIRQKVDSFFDVRNYDYMEDEIVELPYVVATYPDAVIVHEPRENKLYEIDVSEVVDGDAVDYVLGTPKEVKQAYVLKSLLNANPDFTFKDVSGIIDAWPQWAGSFTECVASLKDRPGIENPEALCAWLHYQAEGKWPAEKSRKEAEEMGKSAEKHLPGEHDQSEHSPTGMTAEQRQETQTALAEYAAANDRKGGDKESAKMARTASTKVGQGKGFNDMNLGEREVAAEALSEHVQSLKDDPMSPQHAGDDADPDIKAEIKESEIALSKAEYARDNFSDPAAQQMMQEQQAGKSGSNELTGLIVMKNAAKRIAYAAVLVPGEEDSLGEPPISADRVEKAAHEWMEHYRHVDLQHGLNNVGVPVESYLLPEDMTVKDVYQGKDMFLPKGTWILGSKTDEKTWDMVEKGALTGYSIMGIRKSAALKSEKDTVLKGQRTLLKDLGEDWIAACVSFVDTPAVPKAKFFALKSKDEIVEDADEANKPSLWDRITAAISGKETSKKEGRKFSEPVINKLKDLESILAELLAEAEAERAEKSEEGGDEVNKEEVREMLNSFKAEILEEVKNDKNDEAKKSEEETSEESTEENTEKTEGATEEETEETSEGEVTEDDAQDDEGDESFKSEVMSRLDKVEKRSVKSRAIKGQDGVEDDPKDRSEKLGRDIHGRRKKQ